MIDKLKNASFLAEPTFCDWATLLRDIPVGIFITNWEGELCYINDFLHQVLKTIPWMGISRRIFLITK